MAENNVLYCTVVHSVSVRKPSAQMSNFWAVQNRFGYFISEPNFGYPHTFIIIIIITDNEAYS